MSQISGALTLELDLDRLAEQIAQRVAALLNNQDFSEKNLREAKPADLPITDGEHEGYSVGGRNSEEGVRRPKLLRRPPDEPA